jgi:hypothetical protein
MLSTKTMLFINSTKVALCRNPVSRLRGRWHRKIGGDQNLHDTDLALRDGSGGRME